MTKSETNSVLTREQILNAPLRTVIVEVQEWGGSVMVQELTAAEIQANSRAVLRSNGKPDYSKAAKLPAQLCLQKIVDADGKRIFSEKDVVRLEGRHASAITKISKEIRRMSGQQEGNLEDWLDDNYPDILREYQEENTPVKRAAADF